MSGADQGGGPTLSTARSVINYIRSHSRSRLAEQDIARGQIDLAIWDQGCDSFRTPPMGVHFLAICLDGSAAAEIDFDQRIGPRQAPITVGRLCYVPIRNATQVAFDGESRRCT